VRRGRSALFLLCAAAFIAVADTTIVSTLLPSIRWELRFSGTDTQWILNGFTLTFGGLLLLGDGATLQAIDQLQTTVADEALYRATGADGNR
jgi:hypothetical protein